MGVIATKPWFGLREVGSILSHPVTPPDARLAAQWAGEGDTPFWLSRSSWGMAALADAARAGLGRDVRVWLPEYFCEQALWPLRQRPVDLHFYPVDERARPDWGRIGKGEPPPDIFYLTHFFGHANDHAQARAFCDARGALLVEDGTQALGPDAVIGQHGDVVFYSPWKFFPVPNGALMLIRPRAAAWIEPVEQAIKALGAGVSPGLQWLKESALSHAPGGRRGPGGAGAGDYFIDPQIDAMPQRPRPSPVTKPVLATVSLAETGRRRRENDAAVREFCLALPGWQAFDPTPSQGPMRSVFRLDSPERADAAHAALRQAGVVAEGWPGLPPEVAAPTSQGVRLRRTVLNLPCHQDLTPGVLTGALQRSGLK
jgi:hypothetical protein